MSPLQTGRDSHHRIARRPATRAGRAVGGLATGVIFVALMSCAKEAPEPATPSPASEASAPALSSANAPAVPEPVRKVLGKWMRADGGYVLEIRGADLSGVLDAAYFNPKSINISRAIWMQGPAGFQVVVELNDVGYPGATYVLSHDPQTDRLVGQYNQPAMQQSFDIEFIRQPKS
jgi:hypothetical protein